MGGGESNVVRLNHVLQLIVQIGRILSIQQPNTQTQLKIEQFSYFQATPSNRYQEYFFLILIFEHFFQRAANLFLSTL